MIDPGHPFSVPYVDVIAALEDRVRHGTEQPAQWRFYYRGTLSAYELPRIARSITSVSTVGGGALNVFVPDTDYELVNNRLRWVDGGKRPAEAAAVDVEYTYREPPSGLTDFNEGSVAGTLIRAVAREMKVVYEQMDQAYRRAFIDIAEGTALDGVVALLGVTRNPAIAARGPVTYIRRAAVKTEVVVPAGARVAEPGGRTFRTLANAVIPVELTEPVRRAGSELRTTDRIAKLVGVWPDGVAQLPAANLAPKPKPPKPFGPDERTVTLDVIPTAELLQVRYAPKSATVQVEAVLPGPEGNLDSGAITVMPTPPAGVMGVVNEAPTLGGRPPEPDDQLRERAKHALERAGNATLNALRFSVLDVDGVDEVEVVDHASDPSLALGEVRLRYSIFGDRAELSADVKRTVDATRAAGIRVVAELIDTVLVSGTFFLVGQPGAPAAAAESFVAAVIEEIDALTIGAPLSARRLNAHAYRVSGLADALEAQLHAKQGPIGDPFVVTSAELVRADAENLHAVVLRALRVSATRELPKATEVDVQLVDGGGVAMAAAGAVTLKLFVDIAAKLQSAPTQAPVRVGQIQRDVVFEAGTTATVTIAPADYEDYRPAVHEQQLVATIAAAAYPGLQPATATVTAVTP